MVLAGVVLRGNYGNDGSMKGEKADEEKEMN